MKTKSHTQKTSRRTQNSSRTKTPTTLKTNVPTGAVWCKKHTLPVGKNKKRCGTGCYVVFFGADWCGHCVAFKDEWNAFVQKVKASTDPVVSNITTAHIQSKDTDSSRRLMTFAGVSSYPTILAFYNGRRIAEFEGQRTSSELIEFSKQTFGLLLAKNYQRKQAGGGIGTNAAAVPYPPGSPALGPPFDVSSPVPPYQQASSPTTSMPPPPYNAGLYTGTPFNGPWGNIPVTPTPAAYIHGNLRSAQPPPGATSQYPTAAFTRPGNNFAAMPGVNHYTKSGKGPNRILCTGCTRTLGISSKSTGATKVGGGRRHKKHTQRSRRTKSTRIHHRHIYQPTKIR